MTSAAARSGQRGSNSLTAIPRMARRPSREPWLTSDWIAPPARGGGSEFARLLCHSKKKGHDLSSCPSFWSGQRGSNSLPPSREWLLPFAGALAHLGLDRASGAGWRQRVRRGFSVIPKRKDTTCRRVLLFGAGNEARTRLPPSREWLAAIRRIPSSPRIGSRLRRGVEAASSLGFSVIPKRKDTTCRRVLLFGAGNEARTRFPPSREWLLPFAGALAHLGLDRASGAGWRQRVRRGFSVIPKRKDTTCRRVLLFGAGNEARTRFPPSREWLAAIRRTPGSPRIGSRLRRGVEAASSAGLLCHSKKKGHDLSSCPSFWSGQRGSNSLPAIPRMARRYSQDPWLTSDWIAPPARGGGSEFARLLCHSKKKGHDLSSCPSFWSGQRGSNSLPPPWQGGALPDELCPRNKGYFNRETPACQASSSRFSPVPETAAAPSPSAGC